MQSIISKEIRHACTATYGPNNIDDQIHQQQTKYAIRDPMKKHATYPLLKDVCMVEKD